MGTVRYRAYSGKKVYFIDWIDGRGVRRREVIGEGPQARQLAPRILVQKEAEAVLGKHGIRPAETPRFNDFAQDWMRRKAGRVKPKTIESYEGALARLRPHFGEARLGVITRKDVEDFIAELSERGLRRSKYGKPRRLAHKTINITLVVLKGILKEAVELQLLDANPAAGVRPLPTHRPDELIDEKVRVLQPAELEALLAVADESWRTLWRLMGRAGLRRGEALGAQWDDLDLRGGRLHVRRSIGRLRRRDGKGYEVMVTPLKSKYSRRTVPLSPDLGDALQALEIQAQVEHGTAEGYIFRSQAGGPIDPDNVDRKFKRHLRLAELPGFFRVHDLRHTAASHLLAARIPMKTVQVILGHASFRTTADTYGHLLESSLDGVGRQLQTFLQGTRKARTARKEVARTGHLGKRASDTGFAGVTDGT